jgi:hypothetical protein
MVSMRQILAACVAVTGLLTGAARAADDDRETVLKLGSFAITTVHSGAQDIKLKSFAVVENKEKDRCMVTMTMNYVDKLSGERYLVDMAFIFAEGNGGPKCLWIDWNDFNPVPGLPGWKEHLRRELEKKLERKK